MHSTREVTVDGVTVSLLDSGRGAPLVFLHGSAGRPGLAPFFLEMATDHRVLVPEHPGYGRSTRIPWVRDITDLALYYRHLLRDVLGLDAVTLVGHNVGGWLAVEMSIWFPELVSRLVLLDAHGLRLARSPSLDLFTVPGAQLQVAGWADPERAPEPRPPADLVGIRNKAMTAQLAWNPRLHGPRLAERLRWITAPTLVVWGEADRVVPVQHADAYTESIPGAERTLIPDAGHYPHLEQPTAVAAAIRTFLKQTSEVPA